MVKVVLIHRTKDLESSKALIKVIKKVRAVASKQPGFVYGETLVNAENPCHIIVISTWKSDGDWEAWDKSAARAATKPDIQTLLTEPFDTFIHPEPAVWREDMVNTFGESA
jgi:heme oxygenase (mycobilin-producing)